MSSNAHDAKMIATRACDFSSPLSSASPSGAFVTVTIPNFSFFSPSLNPNIIRHRSSSTRRLLRRLSFSRNETQSFPLPFAANSASHHSRTFVEHVAGTPHQTIEVYDFGDLESARNDLRNVATRRVETDVEVREIEDLPEEWRRSKLAWLCKEVPSHKAVTLVRLLNAQKKWVRQEDATYICVHCTRIRENETGFRVIINK